MKRFRLAGLPLHLLVLGLCATAACTAQDPEPTIAETGEQQRVTSPRSFGDPVDQFGDFWYQGKAELTSYDLEQARYGEIHPGHAVLIFVTEDFSRSKQVKLDDPGTASEDMVKVLKFNSTRSFNTGIYPYSMMTSVFTPVYRSADPRTLKVTSTSQEWCGHTYSQINRTSDGYELHAFSYFEGEGDLTESIPDVWLEDEIWTVIRLNPQDLPTGEIEFLPGTLIQRLRHSSWKAEPATATLLPADGKPGRSVYRIEYPDRTLSIEYQDAFPHEIQGWEDSCQSGWGREAKQLTSKATLKKRIWLDYWTKNGVEDSSYRKQLGLD